MPAACSYVRSDDSSPFDDRFDALDPRARARIDTAVRKLERGLRPDVKPVGEGVSEARVDHGPGYRVYFAMDGVELVVLLLCGDKRRQAEDIGFAKVLWREYRVRRAEAPLGHGSPRALTTKESGDGVDP